MSSGVYIYKDESVLSKSETDFDKIEKVLFGDSGSSEFYLLLDGASSPEVYQLILRAKEEFRCLYRGQLSDDLVMCAPYVLRIRKPSAVALKLIRALFENNSGLIFRAKKNADIDTLRRHFRKFLMAQLPDKKTVYFRFYDPRVLRVYLPTCTEAELKIVYENQVVRYIVPSGEAFGVHVFDPKPAVESV
ncbi:MAG: DUF4123 domain-containing protein [Opitutaceae bacterium]